MQALASKAPTRATTAPRMARMWPRRDMPAGIPGTGHDDTRRSLQVAPAVVDEYTPAAIE